MRNPTREYQIDQPSPKYPVPDNVLDHKVILPAFQGKGEVLFIDNCQPYQW